MKYALIAGLLLVAPGAALAQSSDAPAATTINAHYTLDTPIKDLIADPQAKAVLDKDLPGLSTDENLAKFEDKSLRQLQPLTGGQLTDDLMKQVGGDLAAIGSGDQPATTAAPDDATSNTASPPPSTDHTGPTEGR